MASRRHVLSLCKAALMALSIAAGCSFDGGGPTDEARVATAQFKVTVGQGRLQMVVGESVDLNATVTGSDPSSLYIVTYRSRDARVAAAATDGVITAVGRGETIIDVEATLIDSGLSSAASVVVAVGGGTFVDGGAPPSDSGGVPDASLEAGPADGGVRDGGPVDSGVGVPDAAPPGGGTFDGGPVDGGGGSTSPPANALYFRDCAAGAAAGCVPGNNANPGTLAAPKRTLAGIDLDALPAGATLVFARGGSWSDFRISLDNRNVTLAAPLTFADYGQGPLPRLATGTGTAVSFGQYGDTVVDGGYVFRNLKLDGMGTAQWGAFVQGGTRGVVFDGVEITGFDIGIHSQQSGAGFNQALTVRSSFLHHNREHGFLGDSNELLIEGCRIEDNNPSGGGFEHGIYLGGHSTGLTVRGNAFRRNSVNVATGRCDGGNLTVHGQHDRVTIENNLIEQSASDDGCFGISVTAGYASAEWLRNAVIRNNTIVNLGVCAVCMSAAPGALIEGNKIYNTQARYHVGVLVPAIGVGAGDDVDTGAIVRNNLVCHSLPTTGSASVSAPSAASITGNTYVTGAAATTGVCAR